ncbi:hypothetical protein ACUNV4_14625 [Granulosicoccus sp. 3-233]|uniref:hypothetical protein n=1 Tax=Granulosicoccus sp. 3-233 TaxID=3417969 RepID=UPI003D340711
MNLPSLQYIDINNAISSVIGVSSYPDYSALLRKTPCSRRPQHIVVERTQRRHDRARPGTNDDTRRQPLLLEAWPVFPNSLLSTEIAVNLPGPLQEPLPALLPAELVGQTGGALDFPVDTSLHYRLQEPLPSYLGGLMYRSGRHAIAILDDEANLQRTDTTMMRSLHLALNPMLYGKRTPHEVLIPHFLDSKNEPGGSLKSRRLDKVLVELYQLSHLCHRLNVIGKADLVLCDSAGIAVDALRASVPAAFISGTPSGFEEVQACISRFLEHGDSRRLLEEQQDALADLLDSATSDYHVMSNQCTLRTLIRTRLSEAGRQSTREATGGSTCQDRHGQAGLQSSVNEPDGYEDLILRTQQSLCSRANRSVRLKSGLESSRRKFQKFKESPTRFMEDSQSAILRSLVAGRTAR